jgi:predicted ATPase/class 3 adenylate cyclase
MDQYQYIIGPALRTDSRYVVHRAAQEGDVKGDGNSVMLKFPGSSYPSAQTLKKLREEYAILKKVSHPNVIRVLRLEPFQNKLTLVLEDIKGMSLHDYILEESSELDTFFRIAIPLVDAVKALHQHRIIHKNICSTRIFVDRESGLPMLTGFSLAEELSREALQPNVREIVDADLSFISPEQTARMNRSLDQRTDLYSLGAVFYEMLTERPPFVTDDRMEIIHSHIARQPELPHVINPEIPPVISRMIIRLLAKNAGDRYQSAAGLLYDLKQLHALFVDRTPFDDFTIATRDVSDQFRIPDKLYGRAEEVNSLLQSFDRVADGEEEVVLIAGYSGVGKSRLVSEVQKSIDQSKGYFISGKFDQFKRDIPLSSLLAAFRELIRKLLTESDIRIAEWKLKVLDAVGPNGKIITDVVPEVELLIGLQPEVAELPPTEASNRFNGVFTRFIKIFARPEHPLCIFLDDLQWIDTATRLWIETQLIGDELSHFMLIGAYRDNEVTPSHTLMLMLDRLRQKGVILNEIHLQPLKRGTLNQLVADVLASTPEKCADLSDLIYKKTDGNPFFSRQCLLSLNESDAIFFSSERHAWEYDLDKAHNAEISDNVVELMSAQIQRLTPEAQNTLMIAALIGNEFNVDLLSQVSGQDMESTTEQVSAAAQQGLIIPVYAWDKDEIEDYTFLHDRVQQAALALSDDSRKQVIRLKTGRILLADATISEQEDNIYEIADHLNASVNLIDDSAELHKLVEINLAASRRAKNAMAYDPALRYIKNAMLVLPESAWDEPSALTRDLLLQRAESEHLCGFNEPAEGYYDQAIEHAKGTLEKARVYIRKIHYYSNLRKFNEAYQTGRKAVRPLGVSLPEKFFPPQFLKDLARYRFLIRGKKVADIVDMKEMTDENHKMAVLLMATFARAAYQIKPELCIAVSAKMVNLCLRHGNTDGGFVGYLAFGPIFLGSILNRKQTGFDFGQLTLALVEKYKSMFYKAETHFVVGYFAIPWRRGAIEMERYWQIAYDAGLEAGDFFHTSCACCATVQSNYMRGVDFDEILNTSDRYLEFLQRIDNQEAILTIQSVRQSIRNLRGETISPDSFSTTDFNEEENLEIYKNFSSRHFAHYYYINKMQTLYLWGEYRKAYEMSVISDRYLKDSPGMLHTAEHYFYKGLIICALYKKSSGVQRIKWSRSLKKVRNLLRKYAEGRPDTFAHKYELLAAEILRVTGEPGKSEKHYYKAIDAAAKYGYTNIHALANAAVAQFHADTGRGPMAGFHLREAQYSYKKLGAKAYIDELAHRYEGILGYETLMPGTNGTPDRGADNQGLQDQAEGFDLTTVLKSSEAISREIRLNDLLTSLLKIIIENAGAERMVLLLQQDDRLVVQAECVTGSEDVNILPKVDIADYEYLSKSVVNFVARTLEPVILDEATVQGDYTNDNYFREQHTRSVLCSPLVQKGNLIGIIYLENNLTNAAFTRERIDLLNLLSGQMAISIENALLYENLEEKVIERTRELNEEKNKSEELLLNILPAETAEELKRTGTTKAKDFPMVTVLFTDIENFTAHTESMSAQELVSEINYCYSAFDNIITKYGIEKIKTIGDSYMCAGGLPVQKETNPIDTLRVALEIRDFMLAEKEKREAAGGSFFDMRIGVHTGPVVAGIVGIKKFAYDIWGDTVNIASRMESSGEPGKINISGSTYELVKDKFECTQRGKIKVKNKGKIEMYFVEGVRSIDS